MTNDQTKLEADIAALKTEVDALGTKIDDDLRTLAVLVSQMARLDSQRTEPASTTQATR